MSENIHAPWHAMDIHDVAAALRAEPSEGLTAAGAADRLAQYGPNDVERREAFSWPAALARQFIDPLIIVLLVAAAVSAAVGERVDAATIAVIVSVNGVLGFSQEWRAERSLAALAAMLAPTCTVVRDGRTQTIDARTSTPGDIVVLAGGDRVAADVKLLEANNLTVDEAALTGESAPSPKRVGAEPEDTPLAERATIAYAGTLVATGTARGVVTATGAQAEFGRIAAMAASIRRADTPLQKRLGALGAKLGVAAAVMAAVITAVGPLVADRSLLEMFLTGVSLAVAAVPEGLPAVVALSLTIGVRAMAKRNALVRRLRAAETLGSATIVCTDKTGTLTAGRMEAVTVITADGEVALAGAAPVSAAACAVLQTGGVCNDAAVAADGAVSGSPTEAAIMRAARLHCDDDAFNAVSRVAENPFSSERKRMAVVVEADGAREIHVKGAMELVAPLCARVAAPGGGQEVASDKALGVWRDQAAALGRRGLRVIALARRTAPGDDPCDAESLEHDLTLVGLIGLMDPPRPRARAAVQTAQAAGVRVMMITGDGPDTAAAIADEVGLAPGDVLTGQAIDALDDAALTERLSGVRLLSRATPEHKTRIVSLLQAQGEIVAMTGDGVNDAPALKKADIGVAMGIRGTDAAKAAADMVLLDDDFSTIVEAMREGRRQDDNIRKFVRYLLASNLAEVLAVVVSIVSGAPLILKPVQILWMNLVTDGATALALGMEKAEHDVMDRPPRAPKAPILDRGSLIVIGLVGVVISAVSLTMFGWGLALGLATAQTMALTTLVVLSKAGVLGFRSLRNPMSRIGWFSNPWLWVAIGATVALQLAAVYAPPLQTALGTAALSMRPWLVLGGLAILVVILPEAIKRVRAWRARRSG